MNHSSNIQNNLCPAPLLPVLMNFPRALQYFLFYTTKTFLTSVEDAVGSGLFVSTYMALHLIY